MSSDGRTKDAERTTVSDDLRAAGSTPGLDSNNIVEAGADKLLRIASLAEQLRFFRTEV
jgi:hypothetical protein